MTQSLLWFQPSSEERTDKKKQTNKKERRNTRLTVRTKKRGGGYEMNLSLSYPPGNVPLFRRLPIELFSKYTQPHNLSNIPLFETTEKNNCFFSKNTTTHIFKKNEGG